MNKIINSLNHIKDFEGAYQASGTYVCKQNFYERSEVPASGQLPLAHTLSTTYMQEQYARIYCKFLVLAGKNRPSLPPTERKILYKGVARDRVDQFSRAFLPFPLGVQNAW